MEKWKLEWKHAIIHPNTKMQTVRYFFYVFATKNRHRFFVVAITELSAIYTIKRNILRSIFSFFSFFFLSKQSKQFVGNWSETDDHPINCSALISDFYLKRHKILSISHNFYFQLHFQSFESLIRHLISLFKMHSDLKFFQTWYSCTNIT